MPVIKPLRYNAQPRVKSCATFALLLLAASVLLACAAPGGTKDSGGNGLEGWLERDVYPHVIPRLTKGKHPRLGGKPFIIVATDENDTVLAEIDELRAWVRSEMRAEFMRTPGINLIARPAVEPWRHHRSLTDLSCTEDAQEDVEAYIGIDASIDRLSGDLKVSIVAFGLEEAFKPVTGFSPPRYKDRPSERELSLLRRSETDEYLRGLRPLPFEGNQGDLLASYLAQNLSCLLRELKRELPEGKLQLYAPPPKGEISRVFANTFDSIGKDLGQLREVSITEDLIDADVWLQSKITLVDTQKRLYQLWIDVKRADGSLVGGSQTRAYVRLNAADARDIVAVDSAPAPRPVPARADLIASVAAVTVDSPALCRTQNPWMFGETPVPGRGLPSGACFALKVRMANDAVVSVFGQKAGQMARFYPCDAWGERGGRLVAGQELHVPQGDPPVLVLDNDRGVERFHIFAVADRGAAAALEKRMQHIPGHCTPGLNSRETATVASFERAMRGLAADTRGRVDHKIVQFVHY